MLRDCILHPPLWPALDNYVPEVTKGTNENADEFAQTKEKYLFFKVHILLIALSTEAMRYMSTIQMKSLWQDLLENGDREQKDLRKGTRRTLVW